MRFTFLIEQNVPRFDVSMKNAVLVRVMNGARYLGDEFDAACRIGIGSRFETSSS